MPIKGDTLNTKGRKLSFLLGVGILICPFIFSWFTLRNGYSTIARAVAFGWFGCLAMLIIFTMRDVAISQQAIINTSFDLMINSFENVVYEILQISAMMSPTSGV
jgi:hypothetical protein